MRSPITTETSLYATDYQRWLEQTVVQLRQHQFNHLDLNHLIEELESLGRREKHAISSYLMRLCKHLLKVKYWESDRVTCFRGWDTEIANFCIQIEEKLELSPCLQLFL